ncbi:unnamed protein product, partial [Prorocentrum cordatum]
PPPRGRAAPPPARPFFCSQGSRLHRDTALTFFSTRRAAAMQHGDRRGEGWFSQLLAPGPEPYRGHDGYMLEGRHGGHSRMDTSIDSGSLCMGAEVVQQVPTGAYVFAGEGRGRYQKVTDYRYVGEGGGYEPEMRKIVLSRREDQICRCVCCCGCFLGTLLVVGLVGLLVEHLMAKAPFDCQVGLGHTDTWPADKLDRGAATGRKSAARWPTSAPCRTCSRRRRRPTRQPSRPTTARPGTTSGRLGGTTRRRAGAARGSTAAARCSTASTSLTCRPGRLRSRHGAAATTGWLARAPPRRRPLSTTAWQVPSSGSRRGLSTRTSLKHWCCKHEERGCDLPREEYDCKKAEREGTWEAWRREYCCEKESR